MFPLKASRARACGYLLILVVVLVAFLTLSSPALALSASQTITTGLEQAAEGSYETGSLTTFIGNMIRAILGATGIVFLVLTVYAGILYMTAAGNTERVKKAKDMLVQAVVGLVIIIGAYAIATYVVEALT